MGETILLDQTELDQEWVDLILTALQMGISAEEIKAFLKKNKSNSMLT